MKEDRVRVGVLSFHNSKESKAICNAIEELGHEPVWLRENNVLLRFTDGRFVLEPDVDVVINRLLLSTAKQPMESIGIANAIACFRPMVNAPDAAALASHKIAAAAALVQEGVPIPETALALGTSTVGRIRPEFGEEFVYKTIVGTHGGGAWKVHQTDLITGTVGMRRAFLQELVQTNRERPRDLRVYVVDGSVVGAMYRYAVEEDWRTNVARGGSVEDATESLPDPVEAIAKRATSAVGLDCAGVDLIEGDDNWFVLEVNPTAGFKGLFDATGRSPAPAIAKLAIQRAGGSVNDELVDVLRTTLDGSVPSRASKRVQPIGSEAPVVGLTERVVVSGTTDTKSVTGRTDPTSARTRIDLQLAAGIGAGPIQVGHSESDRNGRRHRQPVVDIVVGIAGTEKTVDATVEDRAEHTYPLLIGRDVLSDFRIDVGNRYDERESDRLEE
ncbi:alpha-L-glutamate ligase, RimK family [Natronorubrum sediminis]|uniref:Alpha-L-glutamate ligase, RimK family n=1 Tax=Natronorubrum sediminis TaxID=640943 RepID=A0A1H6G4W3_9EURY|nr:RimK family alpha-L-glutamate ligase [Natronorubrum sediminis]SEH18121.1 alpha-L-glutamate ligase, RimK family [Natronorubrum sediminis]